MVIDHSSPMTLSLVILFFLAPFPNSRYNRHIMKSVEFEEDNSDFHIKSRSLLGEPETPTMIKFLLKTGMAKNEKQALIILIICIVVALSAAFFIFQGRNGAREAYVVDQYGTRYEMEEYISLVKAGRDPLRK